MFEFKKSNTPGHQPRRSIDGFTPRSSSVSGQSESSLEPSHTPKTDGFSSQNQLDQHMAKALENRAALPIDSPITKQFASHTSKKTKRSGVRKGLRIFGITSGVVVVCALLVGGFMFGKLWLTANNILKGGGNSSTLFSTEIEPETLRGEGDGRVNVLLAGIGGGGRAGANLTDTIMIASIDPIAKDVALLSIPRDLWVRVPDFWTMKINAAYSSSYERALENGATEDEAEEAGFETLEKTIEEYIGVPIHYHAMVDFQAFQEGVDAVGGITVNVEEPLYDSFLYPENNGLIAPAGVQQFDGITALRYSQSRYSSSDFARGERQRQVIIALKDKVLSSGTFSNPKTVSSLLDALGDNVRINASLGELMRMYEISKDIPSTSIANVGLTDEGNVLVTTDSVNDQSIVRPKAGINDFSEIQSFVRNTLRDPFLKSENATIAVLNGTSTPGLATKKADELKSYGYNVTVIDDAPTKDYQNTVIYDKTGEQKKFTRNYLEKRVGVSVTSEPASSNPILVTADFIVVLGQNEVTTSSN